MNGGTEREIRELQFKLRTLGYYQGELTGVLDKKTKKAAKAFQTEHVPKARGKEKTGKKEGAAGQATADAINEQYELLLAQRRFGIPYLDQEANTRLQRAGVFGWSDVLRFDTGLLHDQTKLDRDLLARLRQIAEISSSTGLNPRNSYALAHVGGITSVEQVHARSEEELRSIFKTAQDRSMLSDADQTQIEFFLRTVAARSKEIFSDVRSVFPTIEEDEAGKLAAIGILRGRDLRSMDVEAVADEIGLDLERLEFLRHAAELVQIRGITSNMAIVLARKGRVGGIRGLADIDGAALLEMLERLKENGELEPEEADISEPQAEDIVEAAQEAECLSYPCSDEAYKDYLAGLLGGPEAEEMLAALAAGAIDLDQAILALQEDLCDRGKPFETWQPWCLAESLEKFPELFYEFKVPMLTGTSDVDELVSLVEMVRDDHWRIYEDYGVGEGHQNVHLCLSESPKVIRADARISEGHSDVAKLEFTSAIYRYTEAETLLLSTLSQVTGDLGWTSKRLDDLADPFDETDDDERRTLLTLLLDSIENSWGIPEGWLGFIPPSGTKVEYALRREFDLASYGEVGANGLTEILQSSNTIMHWANRTLQGPPGIPRYDSNIADRIISLILHHLCFVLPLSKGDVYREMGEFAKAQSYYNLVYDFRNEEEIYPYLNPLIELPLVRIRYGSNLLEWAESLYRENTAESIRQAKCLYGKVLDHYDDCPANSEDQFLEMSNAINALSDLNYDNMPTSSSFEQVIGAVGKIQYRPVPAGQIPDLFKTIAATIPDPDERSAEGLSKAAVELSTLLDLEIRFSPNREVFVVAEVSDTPSSSANAMTPSISSAEGGQFFSTTTLADTLPPSTSCKLPCNPVIEAQVQKALMRLSQIRRGVNILGYRSDLVPIHRYSFLINQARMFVQLAVEAEKDFIQFLANAEEESFNQLTAQQAAAVAAANVRVEQAKVNVAQRQIGLARLQRAQLEQEITNLAIEIDEAKDQIFEDAEWAQASDEYASTVSMFGIPVGTIANQFTGGQAGEQLSWPAEFFAGRFGTLAQSLDTFPVTRWFGEYSTRTPIQLRREAAAKARQNSISKLTRQRALLEEFGRPIAKQQVNIAVAEHELAQRQVAVAQLQVTHAQQILNFLQTKFLNKELWCELAKEIRTIYRKLLDYAITAAFLAEQALEFEMNQRLNVIRFDYYKPDRHGLLGAENLQADIATLEYQKILLSDKKIPVKAVISIGEEYPQELLRFTSKGRAHFATDFSQFDLLYPGAYQSRISRVEVVIEGLAPPEGIHGTLSTSGVSYVRTPDNRIQPLAGNAETMILSSYTIRGDQVVFYKTGEELELFEGLGVVTDWTLEMPKVANNMNYQTITDVKLVIYYTALFDDGLRELDIRRWPKSGDAYRGFSMRFQFPDTFYHFNNDIARTQALCVDRASFVAGLGAGPLSQGVREALEGNGISLSANATANRPEESDGNEWQIIDPDNNKTYFLTSGDGRLGLADSDGGQFWATLTFKTSDASFPTNQEHRRLVNVNIVLTSADTPVPAPIPFILCSEPAGGGTPVVAYDDFSRQDGLNHVRASSNVDVLQSDGTPAPESPLNVFAGLDMNREWRLQLNLNPASHPTLFRQNDAGDHTPDLSQIVDILFFVEYRYDRPDLTISEHFDDRAAHWRPIDISVGNTEGELGPWQVQSGHYCGSDPRLQSRLDVDAALSHLPSGTQDRRKQLIGDNAMISYRTMLSITDNDLNFSLFYFADGRYLLMLRIGQDSPSISLWKLSTPYNCLSATGFLGGTGSQDFLLIPGRWYTVDVGKFGGRIDVSIDGAEVLNVFDGAPEEGPGIGVGTGGTGSVYFDDILI